MTNSSYDSFFRYRTKDNRSPQGLPRIFFSCHLSDFARHFDRIAGDLLDAHSNAAVWYPEPGNQPELTEAVREALEQMQLFVMPVSSDFLLQPNEAREKYLPFAKESHIPLLMILTEPGLENEFNERCGTIQALDQDSDARDPSVIPYKDKLKKLLDSALVSDETAEKIRAAFDAYIFLSYRKKDRKHARDLMELIHENEFCRDVAIWYDEFLTPGEDFNEAIKAALEKCSLFTMVVTPHLLEDPNYVMTDEYPAARESKKDILPVESLKTDRASMENHYADIKPFIPADNAEGLTDALYSYFGEIGKSEGREKASHLYFIGLAYLNGIDVEVNHGRAFSLIRRAADKGLPAAAKQVAYMYENGVCVETDTLAAYEWYDKAAALLRKEAEEDLSSADKSAAVYDALSDLAELQGRDYRMRDRRKATLHKMEEWAGTEYRNKLASSLSHLADVYKKLAGEADIDDDYEEAAKYWNRSIPVVQERIDSTVFKGVSIRYLTGCYINAAKAELEAGHFKEAEDHCKKALFLAEHEKDLLSDSTALIFFLLARIVEKARRFEDAEYYYLQASSLYEEEERRTGKRPANLHHCHGGLERCAAALGRPDEAEVWRRKDMSVIMRTWIE